MLCPASRANSAATAARTYTRHIDCFRLPPDSQFIEPYAQRQVPRQTMPACVACTMSADVVARQVKLSAIYNSCSIRYTGLDHKRGTHWMSLLLRVEIHPRRMPMRRATHLSR
jgi:hypothetical protein